MKKTLIASAIAAATLSTGAFAMDNTHADKILGMVEGMPKISGDIEIFASYIDQDGFDNTDGIMDDVDSSIAISHETMISEETTAYASIEYVYNSTQSGSHLELDSAVIGFKGGFGDISLGTQDSVYEDVDIIDFSENLGGVVGGDLLDASESHTINYSSPSIEDMLTIHASIQTAEKADDTTTELDNIGALVVSYEQDNLAVNLGYGINDVADDVIGLSAAYSMDDLTLTAQYEMAGESASGAKDGVDFYGVLATYVMDANTFNFGIMVSDPETGDETTGISGNVIHSLAENVYVYAEASFQSSDTDANEMDMYNIGATYSF